MGSSRGVAVIVALVLALSGCSEQAKPTLGQNWDIFVNQLHEIF